MECSFKMEVGQGQYCKVKTADLITGACTKEKNYGFDVGKPCILIKLNKIYGWKPEPSKVYIDCNQGQIVLIPFFRKKSQISKFLR